MSEPVWVPIAVISIIHDRQIARHGGAAGTRDLGLLEMGCARALNLNAYAEPNVFEIAAAYAFGIVKAHAFVDGNKRTGFVTAVTFLRLNGWQFRPEPVEGVQMMEGLADGEISEAQFASWLAAGATPLTQV